MQSTSSVSQGSFLFLPKGFSLSKTKKSKKRKHDEEESLPLWEKAFNNVWKSIEKELKIVNHQLFESVLKGLIKHIKTLHNDVKMEEGILPCEILLTGSNLPDHSLLIATLSDSIRKEVSPHISILWSRNCVNIKNVVTSFVRQILPVTSSSDGNLSGDGKSDEEDSDEDEISDETSSKVKLQSSQYNMSTLCAWYSLRVKDSKKTKPVVIFIPDFESFPPTLLADFILLLSSYSSHVPFILVFGVATTPGAVYQSLPRNVLSQLVIQLFKSEPSISFLNQIVDKIFFSDKCPFRIGGKCMTFLTDVFLFHSFSVQGFVQGFKFCMMEHFYKKNYSVLCCCVEDLEDEIEKLNDDELENIRKIPSFQKHVEESSKENRKLLLLDNDHTKNAVVEMVKEVQEHLSNFQVTLKCLHILTHDLPQCPLGLQVREYYCKSISEDITQCSEYKECFKLLHLQSRSELTVKVSLIIDLLKFSSLVDILASDKNTFDPLITNLEEYKKKFYKIGVDGNLILGDGGQNEFQEVRKSLLDYIENDLIKAMLKPINDFPLHEIIVFDDLQSVRRRISGSPRGAIHVALNNPQYYLDCKCCKLSHPEAVIPTLPDLSIAYKLHLEFGKVINLMDWLQAFATCVKPNWEETDGDEVDVEIQARFTRAVSELQFLGFIKPSRSKADHVLRLTWGSF